MLHRVGLAEPSSPLQQQLQWYHMVWIMLLTCAIQPCQTWLPGEVFGRDQPIALQLLGSQRSREAMEGVAMELEDSLYPLLREVRGR